MKKLNKLQVNSNKLMEQKELVSLKGGGEPCTCLCWEINNPTHYYGYYVSSSGYCLYSCQEAFGSWATGECQ
jgi:hypothetical protein